MNDFSLLGAALAAVAAVYVMLRWEARHGNAASCTRDLWDVAVTAMIAGLAAGRLWAMIRAGVNPLQHPGDIIIVRGGVDTAAAAVTAVAAVAVLARGEVAAVADGLAAATLAGLAGWHTGCLLQDTCAGVTTDLPWAIHLTGSDVGRHPVELYAAAALAGAALAVALWKGRVPPAGIPAAAALAAAGIVRAVTEPLRPSLVGGPVWLYLMGAAAGVGIVWWQNRANTATGP